MIISKAMLESVVSENSDSSDYSVAAIRALRDANSHPIGHIDHGKYMAVHHMAMHEKFAREGNTAHAELHKDLHDAYDKHVRKQIGKLTDHDFHGQFSHHWNDLNAAYDKE